MGTARLLLGDVFDRMAELPDASVDLVLTSPPFLALRSYLPADHPDKAKEIGSEPTPAAFLDTLLALTAEWRRVLAPHGSICVELGDTYSGSTATGGDYKPEGEWTKYKRGDLAGASITKRSGDAWPLAKSLCGIPHLYHLSLAYGRNLLTGEPSPAGDWRVRNVVAWCRPNPPVGALGDKFRPGTSYMTVACVSGSRYFDLDAVRTVNDRTTEVVKQSVKRQGRFVPGSGPESKPLGAVLENNPAGAPPLDWWEIPTQPYAGAHYATWPAELCRKPIESMCPQRVCTTCGRPSTRIVEREQFMLQGAHSSTHRKDPTKGRLVPREGKTTGRRQDGDDSTAGGPDNQGFVTQTTTLGWSDCGHGTWRNGLVLDPFAGSGTTLAVATGHGRDAIGIDLDPRNAQLCAERVGMFLEVEEPELPPLCG